MMGHIQDAADTALQNPARYPELYAREIAPREVGSPQRVRFDRDVGADRAIGD